MREPELTPLAAGALGAAIAWATAFAGSALIAWCGPVDRPGRRTSHDAPTPTSGGLAILAGTCAGVLLAAWLLAPWIDPIPRAWREVALALACATLLGLIGTADDLVDLPATPKLLAMFAAGAALILATSPALRLLTGAPTLGSFTHLLALTVGGGWLLLAVNAVNFMDGANGLVAGALAIAFAALALAVGAAGRPEISACALAACSANAGFLPWNLGGRLFQGDAGALFSGLLFAALCLLAREAIGPAFGPLALLPLLLDVLHTLLRRARARRPLMQAHREHLYQRWLAATGASHPALAWRVWALTGVCAALAVATTRLPTLAQAEIALAAAALLSAGWIWLSARLDARLTPSG